MADTTLRSDADHEAIRYAREFVADPDKRAQVKVQLAANGWPQLADLIDEAVIVSRAYLALLSAQGTQEPVGTQGMEAVPVSEIEAEIAHIEENGARVKELPGMADEGRCRELCAMYLREMILNMRAGKKLTALQSERAPQEVREGAKVPDEWRKLAINVWVETGHPDAARLHREMLAAAPDAPRADGGEG